MKHSLETLTTAAGILLMAFLSCLLLPAPALGLTLAQKLVTTFHLMDLSQLYTLLFCLWFLVLGAIEYFFSTLYLPTLVLAGGLNVDYRRTSRHTLLILLRLKERLWISNHCTKRRNAWLLSYPCRALLAFWPGVRCF